MSKNVVKRLQNLENDIKTIFNIYDAADEQIFKMSKSVEVDPRAHYKKSRGQSSEESEALVRSRSTESSTLSKADSRSPPKTTARKSIASDSLDPSKKLQVIKKPGSAPSSAGLSASFQNTICPKCKNRSFACECKLAKKTSKTEKKPHDLGMISTKKDRFGQSSTSTSKTASKKPSDLKKPGSREFPRRANDIEKFFVKPGTAPSDKSSSENHSVDSSPTSSKPTSRKKSRNRLSSEHVKTRAQTPEWRKETVSSFSEKQISQEVKKATAKLSKVDQPTNTEQHQKMKNMDSDSKVLSPNERLEDDEKYNVLIGKIEEMKKKKDVAIDIAKQLKDKYETIQITKRDLYDRIGKLQESNKQLRRDILELNNSKERMLVKMEELKKEQRLVHVDREKSKEIKEENDNLKEKLKEMATKLQEKEHQLNNLSKSRFPLESNEVNDVVERKSSEYRKLLDKQQTANHELIAKLNTLEVELRKTKTREKRLIEVKGEIRKKYVRMEEELHKTKIEFNEIQKLNAQMKNANAMMAEELRKQQVDLDFKSERLEDTSRELESIRKKSQALEEQVKTLRHSIENFDLMHQDLEKRSRDCEEQSKSDQEKIRDMEEEKEKMMQELEETKDSVLIKNKIIDDQQQTIKQLRDKGEEMKAMVRRNQSLERILSLEREEKLEMQEMIENLRWRKEELKRKVKALEEDLLLAPQEVVRDLQKTQSVLHELENQVQIKQKEWEIHLQTLIKEKEKACTVAEFATKKLMQTTSEFQKQSEVQKRLHRVLAENLAEKERHLKEVNEKVSNTDLEHAIIKLQSETKRTSRAMDRHRCTANQTAQEWCQRLTSRI